jgi:cytochrome c oxidase subunit III
MLMPNWRRPLLSSAPEALALREQFATPGQQKEASFLGMWTFLITEIMFFGGMFLAYSIYRSAYPLVFARASNSLNMVIGAVNTAVLLCSSFTMVMAVHSAQIGNRRWLIWCLIFTILLGGAFLGIKGYEWWEKFEEHHVPGPTFHLEGETQQGRSELFFSLYFLMTGIHALHMVVGVGIMLVLLYFAYRGRFTPEYYTPIDVGGLYWHFVDIIWIFLFPLLYLVGRHYHGHV